MTVIVTEEVIQKVIVHTGAVGPSGAGGGGGGGAVDSVNGETGAVVLDAADVGAAATSHTHAQSEVTGLEAALTAKQDAATAATDAELTAGLATKAAASHTHAQSEVTGLEAALSGLDSDKQDVSEKGAAGGYASLDGGGKVPVGQLPASLMTYLGVWNASTNSPALADGSGDTGDVYRVGTAGSQDLGSGSISFGVGDYVIYNGSTWEKSDTTDAVASVAGKTGVVTLDQADITNLVSDLAAKQAASVIAANGLGVCVHGATAGTARPTGFAVVFWIGTVEPSNAVDNDVWMNTT